MLFCNMAFLSLPSRIPTLEPAQKSTTFLNYHDGTQNNRIRNQTLYHRTRIHSRTIRLQCARPHGRRFITSCHEPL